MTNTAILNTSNKKKNKKNKKKNKKKKKKIPQFPSGLFFFNLQIDYAH